MEKRINRQLLLMGFVTAFLSLILSTTIFLSVYENQVKVSLRTDLDLIVSTYSSVGHIDFLSDFETDHLRVTVIERDGTVIFDTYHDGEMTDHSDRPEIQKAFQDGYAEGNRFSETLGEKTYYAARKTDDGFVIRCSVPAAVVYDYLKSASVYLLLIFLSVLVLSIWLSAMLTERLITPLRIIADDLENPKLLTNRDDTIYPELVPIIQELRLKRKELRSKADEIETAHRRLTAVLEHMEEGMLLLDGDGYILTINSSACAYLHFDGKPIGRHFLDLCLDVSLLDALQTAYTGERCAFDSAVDGRLLRVMVDPVLHQTSVLGAACLFVDVTERREIERMKQEFTANVSHELKTPLTSISGYAEMIENGMVQPKDIPRFASHIHSEASRLLLLIADIISLSEIEEKGAILQKQTLDLYAIAQLCVHQLQAVADQRNVSLTLDGLHTKLHADPTMLSQLCYNLIDNAIRYNRTDGQVHITIGERMITVRDTGIGIPAEHRSRVFERFYRVDKSRSKETGGTGLGLAIVKHIADAHGATITLNSTENEGTTICVVFPA